MPDPADNAAAKGGELTSAMVKAVARAAGADLCGIGSLDRFDGAPPAMDPRQVSARARSLICLGFRIPRGVQRGIERGTQFFQYPSLAYGGINEIYAPAVLYRLGQYIEDRGYEAVLYRNTGGRGVVSDMDGSPGNTITPEEEIDADESGAPGSSAPRCIRFTRPVRPGSTAPDVQFNFRLAAVACGLGEIGWSKMLLTPEFGPMVRVAFIFTDAPLEADPMYDGPPLCLRCYACVRECPGGCLSREEGITVSIGGKHCEWGRIDEWKCFAFYTHGGPRFNPFVPPEVWEANENGALDLMAGKTPADADGVARVYGALADYFPSWIGYNMAKCGGCLRACVARLEKKDGCLRDRFRKPLREGKPWSLEP